MRILAFIVLVAITSIARAAEPTPLTFQLDWKPNAQFAGILLALDRGWYREAGIALTLAPLPANEAVVSNVVAGTNWLGCCESGVLLGARARGAPVKAFGTMLQGTPMCLISLEKTGLRAPADLAGRRLGLHADGNDAIDFVLRRAGLDRSKVRIDIMPHDHAPLLEGRFDVVQGYAVDEAVDLELAGHRLNLLYFHDHGYAAYGQAYFTTETMLRDQGPLLRTFLKVSGRGWQAAARERDAAVDLILTKHLPAADRQHQRRALDAIVPLLTRESGAGSEGRMRRETWGAAVTAYNNLPSIPRTLKLDEVAVFDIGP
jgi:NitT/TauT family transport system substrate-binding protein